MLNLYNLENRGDTKIASNWMNSPLLFIDFGDTLHHHELLHKNRPKIIGRYILKILIRKEGFVTLL